MSECWRILSLEGEVMTVNEKNSLKKIFMMVGLGILVYVGIKYLLVPTIPFLLGWALACWILPLAKWFERKIHVKRGIVGGVLVGAATLGIGWLFLGLGNLLLKTLSSLVAKVSDWEIQKNRMYHQCCQALERYAGMDEGKVYQFLVLQEENITQRLQNVMSNDGAKYLLGMFKGGIFVVSSVLVVFIFAVLLIKDMEEFQKKIQEIPFTNAVWKIGKDVGRAGGRYLKAQAKIMVVVGLVCVVGLWILGNPQCLLWGVLIGFLDALPVLGVGMILIPWALLWLLRGNYWLFIGYLVLFLVADLVRQFLEPKLLGKEIGIHPALMLIAVYGGIFLYGVAGFILGPISVVIYTNVWKNFKEK